MTKKQLIEQIIMCALVRRSVSISPDDMTIISHMTVKNIKRTSWLIIDGYAKLASVINDDDLAKAEHIRTWNCDEQTADYYDYLHNLIVKYDI